MQFSSYINAQQKLEASGATRLADNRYMFEHNPNPSIAYKLQNGAGVVLHYNAGKGALSGTKTWEEAKARVDTTQPQRERGRGLYRTRK